MATVATVRKLGIIARLVAQQAGRNRTVGAVWNAGRTTLVSFGRVLHQLWLEVTGFIFLAIAAIGGLALGREYVKYQAGRTGPGRLIVASCFTLVFAYFGLSSFWRVRRRAKRDRDAASCVSTGKNHW